MKKHDMFLAAFYAVCICLLILTQYYISKIESRIEEIEEFNKDMWTLK